MASKVNQLIVIVGPTASGKTNLAVEIAKKYNGEVICADSRTIYKELNIGTAKPTKTEMQGIEHHLLGVVSPNETYNVAQFKEAALEKMDQIWSAGKLPILAGGTGLYIDAVIFDYKFNLPSDSKLRKTLQNMSITELQEKINKMSIPMPENKNNPRHLIRAIETKGKLPKKSKMKDNTLVIGVDIDRKALKGRIAKRAQNMIEDGLIEETSILIEKYGEVEALRSTSYRSVMAYLNGEITQKEIPDLFIKNDMQLAKRQMTWLRRNKSIHWISEQIQAVEIVESFLHKSK